MGANTRDPDSRTACLMLDGASRHALEILGMPMATPRELSALNYEAVRSTPGVGFEKAFQLTRWLNEFGLDWSDEA